MKIKLSQLKRIIKEEARRALKETGRSGRNVSAYSSGMGAQADINSILAAHKHLEDAHGTNPDVDMLAAEIGVPRSAILHLIEFNPDSGLYVDPSTDEVFVELYMKKQT